MLKKIALLALALAAMGLSTAEARYWMVMPQNYPNSGPWCYAYVYTGDMESDDNTQYYNSTNSASIAYGSFMAWRQKHQHGPVDRGYVYGEPCSY